MDHFVVGDPNVDRATVRSDRSWIRRPDDDDRRR